MGLETGTYRSDLVGSNPIATDGLAQSDDHLRLIKNTIKNTFPNITGAVSATNTELNVVRNLSPVISTTLNNVDRMVINDVDVGMKQVALSDLETYLTANLAVTSAMITDGTITSGDIGDGQVTASKLATDVITIPSGIIMPFAGTTPPTGYLFCYGQDISRTTFASLFAAIGTTYGSGDGSATFALPDLRGRVIGGKDDMGGTGANRLNVSAGVIDGDGLGNSGGSETVTLTTSQMPAHTHTGNVALRTNWERGSSSQSPVGTGSARYDGGGSNPDFTTASTGGGTAHSNVQPTIILNYIIKF